jgi:hypothetical protein
MKTKSDPNGIGLGVAPLRDGAIHSLFLHAKPQNSKNHDLPAPYHTINTILTQPARFGLRQRPFPASCFLLFLPTP